MNSNFKKIKTQVKVGMIKYGSTAFDLLPSWYFPLNASQSSTSPHFVVFYISAKGSLGDEAMGYSIIHQIREKEPEAKITFLIHRDKDQSHFEKFGINVVSIEGYFSILPSRKATLRISKELEACTDFIIPGADVLDGVYSPGGAYRRLFSGLMAQKAGARVHVVGFSYSHRAPDTTNRVYRDKCQDFNIICRDPLSAERLSKVMNRTVPSAADLAFLLPIGSECIHEAAQQAENRVMEWREQGKQVVIFNANPLSFTNALPNVERSKVTQILAESLDKFVASTNSALLFLTHDNRAAHSDAKFVGEIISKMKPNNASFFVPETIEATDIKRLCSLSDLIVTGRMHLGIAGLGASKTTMITDYQGKVRGLYRLFDSPELALDLAEIVKPDELARLMAEALGKRDDFENRISSRLPEVKSLSRKNLEALWAC